MGEEDECAVCGREVERTTEDHWEYHYENDHGMRDVDLICSGKCLGRYMDKLEREEEPETDYFFQGSGIEEVEDE